MRYSGISPALADIILGQRGMLTDDGSALFAHLLDQEIHYLGIGHIFLQGFGNQSGQFFLIRLLLKVAQQAMSSPLLNTFFFLLFFYCSCRRFNGFLLLRFACLFESGMQGLDLGLQGRYLLFNGL